MRCCAKSHRIRSRSCSLYTIYKTPSPQPPAVTPLPLRFVMSALGAYAALAPLPPFSYPLSAAQSTLQRRKAVRDGSRRSLHDPRPLRPSRKATTLQLATPRDIHRLSVSSVNSDTSVSTVSTDASGHTAFSSDSRDSAAQPVTPPASVLDLPIQYTAKLSEMHQSLEKNRSVYVQHETVLPYQDLDEGVSRLRIRSSECGGNRPTGKLECNTSRPPRSVPALRIHIPGTSPIPQPTPSSHTASSVSSYSQSSAASEYNAERIRQTRQQMLEKLMRSRKETRRGTISQSSVDETSAGVGVNTPSEERMAEMWDTTFRLLKWEGVESGIVAAQRRSELERKRRDGYDEWSEGQR